MEVPRTGQENARESSKNSTAAKTNDGQSSRPVLRPLQPNGARLTSSTGSGKKKHTRNRNKVKSSSSSAAADKKCSGNEIKTFLEKGVQTDMTTAETSVDYSMCTAEEPPIEYWQVLAEQRRQALADTLQENEELYTENERLMQRITELERRLESKEYFAMISASGRIIGAKDHASVQICIAEVDEKTGRMNGNSKQLTISGFIRGMGESDGCINRLCSDSGILAGVTEQHE